MSPTLVEADRGWAPPKELNTATATVGRLSCELASAGLRSKSVGCADKYEPAKMNYPKPRPDPCRIRREQL